MNISSKLKPPEDCCGAAESRITRLVSDKQSTQQNSTVGKGLQVYSWKCKSMSKNIGSTQVQFCDRPMLGNRSNCSATVDVAASRGPKAIKCKSAGNSVFRGAQVVSMLLCISESVFPTGHSSSRIDEVSRLLISIEARCSHITQLAELSCAWMHSLWCAACQHLHSPSA